MKTVKISDITLSLPNADGKPYFTFREKIEVAKLLDRLRVSAIELGTLGSATADTLLIKSVASSVKDTTVAVCPGFESETIESVWEALKEAEKPRLQICAAVSTSRMEYVYHKKADAMLETVEAAVKKCRTLCSDVEFIAEDATRADFDFLCKMISAAINAGATTVTVCDSAGASLSEEFGDFIKSITENVGEIKNAVLGVSCSDKLGVASSLSVAAIKNGAGEIKVTSIPSDAVSLLELSKIISAKGDKLDANILVRTTEINRVLKEINKMFQKQSGEKSPFEDGVRTYSENMAFTKENTIEDIVKALESLGYVLEDKDKMRVWKAFSDIAQRKDSVSVGELDAIIASETMQVPPTYTLENFVVTTGNAIDILAHVKLRRGDKILDGLSLGDGPIDAAFLAIENITGHHYELDDFQIQAITEGREAMGQTIVKLRSGGKIYSGKGISTDIIGSGVAAYISALNKIIYEEENS